MKGKVELWAELVPESRLDYFPTLQDYMDENNLELDSGLRRDMVGLILQLRENLEFYFPSEALEEQISHQLMRVPFKASRQQTLLSGQNEQLMELKHRYSLRQAFSSMPLAEFWAVAAEDFPELAGVALRVLVPFVSTYLYETAFSVYTSTKTKYRSRLDAEPDMRTQLTQKVPPFAAIASEKQHHFSH